MRHVSESEIAALEAERDRLRGVLAWYADPATWEMQGTGEYYATYNAGYCEYERAAIQGDEGMRARQALGEVK